MTGNAKESYVDYLHERYALCAESPSGVISRRTGKPVGSLNKRWNYWYLTTTYQGVRKNCRLHRLIWLMVNGPIPDGMVIDHIDRVSSNNKVSNLRAVTPSVNQINTAAQCNNKTGEKNISFCTQRDRYKVQFTRRGNSVRSPRFVTLTEAIHWRDEWEMRND